MTDEMHLFSLDSVLEDFADDILFNNKLQTYCKELTVS